MNAGGRGSSTIFGAGIMVFVHKIEAAATGEPVGAFKITKAIRPKESGGGISPAV